MLVHFFVQHFLLFLKLKPAPNSGHALYSLLNNVFTCNVTSCGLNNVVIVILENFPLLSLVTVLDILYYEHVICYRLCLKLCGRIVSYVSDGRTTSREEILLEVLVCTCGHHNMVFLLFSVWIACWVIRHRVT